MSEIRHHNGEEWHPGLRSECASGCKPFAKGGFIDGPPSHIDLLPGDTLPPLPDSAYAIGSTPLAPADEWVPRPLPDGAYRVLDMSVCDSETCCADLCEDDGS